MVNGGIWLIELKDVESFRKSISAISSFIPEGNLRFNDSGIHLRGVDPSQVVLVDFSMGPECFRKFKVESGLVGVDLTELNKIISRVQSHEALTIDLDESELRISVLSEFEKNFSLPLIDSSREEVSLPKLKPEASVEINARVFKELLKDASVFGSLVVFKVHKNSFFAEAKGSHGSMSGVSKESKSVKVSSTADINAKFSLNFLQNIVKEVEPEQKILLELKSDAPLKVSFNIGQNHFEFFVAHMLL